MRLALVPVALAGEALVDHPTTGGFPVALGVFAAWALLALAVHLTRGPAHALARARVERAAPAIDLAAIVALVDTSGGPFSQTAMAFFVLPVMATARLRPVVTVAWTAAVVAAYVALSLAHRSAGA